MKYIEIVNFSDICSSALLKIIDDTYNKAYYMQDDGLVIDFSQGRMKKMFSYYINKALNSSKSFGKIRLFYDTCRPWDNWRKEIRGQAIKAQKYEISDESLLVNKNKLNSLINSVWNKLQKNQTKNTVSCDSIDSIDMKTILKSIIGDMFISSYCCELKLIKDSNFLYNHGLLNEIPNYLIQEVERELNNMNLI